MTDKSVTEKFVRLYGPKCVSFENAALPPIATTLETVRLHRDRFVYFSDTFKVMGSFIGRVLGKADWSIMDLLEYEIKERDRWNRVPVAYDAPFHKIPPAEGKI